MSQLSVVTDQRYAPLFRDWLTKQFGPHFEDDSNRFIASVIQGETDFEICGVTALNKWGAHTCEAHAASDGSKRQKIDRKYIWTVFDYAFRHAGKNCLLTHVATENVKSIALQHLLGLKHIGHIEGYYGEGKDAELFAITRQQWLDGKWGSLEAPTGDNS